MTTIINAIWNWIHGDAEFCATKRARVYAMARRSRSFDWKWQVNH